MDSLLALALAQELSSAVALLAYDHVVLLALQAVFGPPKPEADTPPTSDEKKNNTSAQMRVKTNAAWKGATALELFIRGVLAI